MSSKQARRDARMDGVFAVIPTDRFMEADEIAAELTRQGHVDGFRDPRAWTRGDVYGAVRDLRLNHPDLGQALISYPRHGFRFSEDLRERDNEKHRRWAARSASARIKTTLHGTVFPLITNERDRRRLQVEFDRLVEDMTDTLLLDGADA